MRINAKVRCGLKVTQINFTTFNVANSPGVPTVKHSSAGIDLHF